MPLVPTPVDVEGPFVYARAAPSAHRGGDREVLVVRRRAAMEVGPRTGRVLTWLAPRAVAARSARAQRLVELGLAGPADLLVGESAGEMLEHAGRVERVAAEVLAGEARLDRVAVRLASLLGGELLGASFEQIAIDSWQGDPWQGDSWQGGGEGCDEHDLAASGERPIGEPPFEEEPRRISSLPDDPEIDADAPIVGLRRLRAHEEPSRAAARPAVLSWEVLAIDRGPWLDLPAVLGLLNTMLRHRGSEQRLVVLRGHDSEARVIAGRETSLRAAVDEGLLAIEGPDDALLRSFDDDDSDVIGPS